MGVAVSVLESGLVHVLVSVVSPVLVGVRVLVLNMLVLVSGVRMGMRRLAVLVFVRVRFLVSVLTCHRPSSPLRRLRTVGRRLVGDHS
jgi:hypothetical protein